jgi:REP element-mobilizing transposase RayT
MSCLPYSPATVRAAYHLRFTVTAWPASGCIPTIDVSGSIRPRWEADGLRLLESSRSDDRIQLAFSAKPTISPVLLGARVKGRLQHAWRAAECEFDGFSRKVAVRALGENTITRIQRYIAGQVRSQRFADDRFQAQLQEFTLHDPVVALSRPTRSARGAYWYNLHVVLTLGRQQRITDPALLATIRDGCLTIARREGNPISSLAVMPDHLHLAIRGNILRTPEDIAIGFLNGLAEIMDRGKLWNDGFYVGTFSDFDFGAIRAKVLPSCQSLLPIHTRWMGPPGGRWSWGPSF